MPVYQYKDMREGGIVELVRSVANRDKVPPYFKRVTVPSKLTVLGTGNNPRDPHGAVSQVPNALKSLSNNQVNDMVRESGMSVDKFKEVWGM